VGQIANQMALELIYKLKEKLTNKEENMKKEKGNTKENEQ